MNKLLVSKIAKEIQADTGAQIIYYYDDPNAILSALKKNIIKANSHLTDDKNLHNTKKTSETRSRLSIDKLKLSKDYKIIEQGNSIIIREDVKNLHNYLLKIGIDYDEADSTDYEDSIENIMTLAKKSNITIESL